MSSNFCLLEGTFLCERVAAYFSSFPSAGFGGRFGGSSLQVGPTHTFFFFTPAPSIKPAAVRDWCLLDIHDFRIMVLTCADEESIPIGADYRVMLSARFLYVCPDRCSSLVLFGASIWKSIMGLFEMCALHCSCMVRVGKRRSFLLLRMAETGKACRNAWKYVITIHRNETVMVGWLVYSCYPHLEHRASVKRFISLQFLNLRHSVGPLGRVISPSQGLYLTNTDIHTLSGIRTHDPSVRASEDS
jgi:hypothetical protein